MENAKMPGMRQKKRWWFLIGFGSLALTAFGAYYYLRTQQDSDNKKVRMVNDMIHEAEKIIRSHRS